MSNSTQPPSGSLTKREVAAASRSKSALESFIPSASHSALTDSQSIPEPLSTSLGFTSRRLRKRRWKLGLPK